MHMDTVTVLMSILCGLTSIVLGLLSYTAITVIRKIDSAVNEIHNINVRVAVLETKIFRPGNAPVPSGVMKHG